MKKYNKKLKNKSFFIDYIGYKTDTFENNPLIKKNPVPLRDSRGRFIGKTNNANLPPKDKSPQRDNKGRFVKKS